MAMTPAANQSATPDALRQQAERHRKHIFALRNISQVLAASLDPWKPVRQAEAEELQGLARGLQRALEEAHNIEAGAKLLVPR